MSPRRIIRRLNGLTLAVATGIAVLAAFTVLAIVIGRDRQAALERIDERNRQTAAIAAATRRACVSANENRAITYAVLNLAYMQSLRRGVLSLDAQAFYEEAFMIADQPACPGLPAPSTLNLSPGVP